MNRTEAVYHCHRCKRDEWCTVYENNAVRIVTALVCGQTKTFRKEAQNEPAI